MSKHLLRLKDCKIAIVCDDSSSMNNSIDNTGVTRWDQLRSIVKTLVEIGILFGAKGVDVHFLNRNAVSNVMDPTTVDQLFQIPPDGFTPLVPVLEKIFQSGLSDHEGNKNLLILVATDGEPTDENGTPNVADLKQLMKKVRHMKTAYVSFLICTEDIDGVAYLNKWCKKMQNVDINYDYKIQRDQIRKCPQRKNYPFSRGDYVVKVMVGAIVPELGHLHG